MSLELNFVMTLLKFQVNRFFGTKLSSYEIDIANVLSLNFWKICYKTVASIQWWTGLELLTDHGELSWALSGVA